MFLRFTPISVLKAGGVLPHSVQILEGPGYLALLRRNRAARREDEQQGDDREPKAGARPHARAPAGENMNA